MPYPLCPTPHALPIMLSSPGWCPCCPFLSLPLPILPQGLLRLSGVILVAAERLPFCTGTAIPSSLFFSAQWTCVSTAASLHRTETEDKGTVRKNAQLCSPLPLTTSCPWLTYSQTSLCSYPPILYTNSVEYLLHILSMLC